MVLKYCIMLADGDKVLIRNVADIAEEFSKCFEKVVNDLDLYQFPSCMNESIIDKIDSVISKFKFHPRILNIKQSFIITEKILI